jgi:uracil-DNA glycosylase family protein
METVQKISVQAPANFAEWRTTCISLLNAGKKPDEIVWTQENQPSLYIGTGPESPQSQTIRIAPKARVLLEKIAAHPSPNRWDLGYRILYRIVLGGERNLLENSADPDVMVALRMEREIDQGVPQAEFMTVAAVPEIADRIQVCRACPIGSNGTRAVSGEGPIDAKVMLVGEQPGDEEEKAGRPFVGPAGAILNEVFQQLPQSRSGVYVTNVVKHFKFVPRGKRRIHDKPNAAEIGVCRNWLEEEIRLIQPKSIVCLGASAAQGVLGFPVSIGQSLNRTFHHAGGTPVYVTYHPAAVLRVLDARLSNSMKDSIRNTLAMAMSRS